MAKIIHIGGTKRNIVPREDFLVMVLRSIETERIIIPESIKDNSELSRFEVIILGPKCKDIKIGDCCVVSPQAMITFKHDNVSYFVTKEENVTVVLRKEE